ncbi:MAG: ABC transporter permease, partial [Acidobacteriaceae bacterium]|nr:ABC transporter permease [Acidobacteriaceae bacterium]
MSWLKYLRRAKRDRELAHDIETYLELEIENNIAAGMNPHDAALAAHRKFGNVTRVKEAVRDMNTFGFLETSWQDLRYGARLLRMNPAFFVVATLSLALGIGANTAIFQLIDTVRLRTLPVSHPEELAEVRLARSEHCCDGSFTSRFSNLTYAQWEQIEALQQGFTSMFAWSDARFNLAPGGQARYVDGLYVTGHFFDTLRVAPLLGRLIGPQHDVKGCGTASVVLGYNFWQREYGGDPKVIGSKITLKAHPAEIIGVAPANFYGVEVGHNFDVAVPTCAEPLIDGPEYSHVDKRNHWWLAA